MVIKFNNLNLKLIIALQKRDLFKPPQLLCKIQKFKLWSKLIEVKFESDTFVWLIKYHFWF